MIMPIRQQTGGHLLLLKYFCRRGKRLRHFVSVGRSNQCSWITMQRLEGSRLISVGGSRRDDSGQVSLTGKLHEQVTSAIERPVT
jgi:hypothetical protein